MNWDDDVLKRKDLIGGDIESVEDGVLYRSPLGEIKTEGNMIHFISPWCAKQNNEDGEWEQYGTLGATKAASVNKTIISPSDGGSGYVKFSIPHIGRFTIRPNNGHQIDPGKVKGLPKASERLLALYPELPFDCIVAQEAVVELQVDQLSPLPPDPTLRDFLAIYPQEASKEEFLWYYIERVTGERQVHFKVY